MFKRQSLINVLIVLAPFLAVFALWYTSADVRERKDVAECLREVTGRLDRASVHLEMARCYERAADRALAIEHYRKVVKLEAEGSVRRTIAEHASLGWSPSRNSICRGNAKTKTPALSR
jgi:hypothetical protein